MANGLTAEQQQGTKGGPAWQWVVDLLGRPDVNGFEAFLLDRGGSVYDVRAWQGVGDGETDCTEAFERAIEAVLNSRTGMGTLQVADGVYLVAASLTIPREVTVRFPQGGRIRPAEGVTVRLNGPIEAGPYQIFEGGSAAVPPEPARVVSVVVTPAAFSIEETETRQLAVQALDAGGVVIPSASFTWTSSNPAVATVNSAGLVTGVMDGSATITARSGGVDGTTMVTVVEPAGAGVLHHIDVTPTSATIEDGATQQFTAAGFDSLGGGVAITPVWASTDTNIATVNASGLATAVEPGQCMITATDTGITGAAVLNVTPVAAPTVTTIVVTPTQVAVEESDTVQLTATAFDQFGEEIAGVQFFWQSSNTTRATVNQTGLVTAVSQGGVIISATANNVVGQATVNVTVEPSGVPLLFSDDFEGYSVGQRVQGVGANGFQWLGGFPTIVVSDEQSFSGNKSLRFDYPGELDLCEDSTREQRFRLTPSAASAPSEIWIEYMVRVPDNWTHRSGCGSTNNKLLSLWAEHYDNREGDAEITLEWARASQSSSFVRYAVYTDVDVEQDIKLAADEQRQLIKGTVFNDSMRGQWIRLRYHYRIGDGSAGDPTIIDVWRDNTKIGAVPTTIDMRDYWVLNIQPRQPGSPWFRNGYVFGWSNSGFTEDTNFYVDDFKVWTQDPGWTF